MNDTEYLRTQEQILLLASMLLDLDLPEFLNRIEMAEAAGPLFNPSLYRQAAGNLADLREVALILNTAKKSLQKLVERREG